MTAPTTMDCPGCGRPGVSRALVACAPCWRRLPGDLVRGINRSTVGTFGRVRAVAACRDWFRANAR